jgi:hypothetical protein
LKRFLLCTSSALCILVSTGCSSLPRFPSETSVTAVQLMGDFGVSETHTLVPRDQIISNTLRIDFKVFVTDKRVFKHYFSPAGRVFIQDHGMTAYGVFTFGRDKLSEGYVTTYTLDSGVFSFDWPSCKPREKLLVAKDRRTGELACWTNSCEHSIPGWGKAFCSIEPGNTLLK